MVVSFSFIHPIRYPHLWLVMVLLLLCSPWAKAEQNMRKTMRVKAAFIYQMSKFVNWTSDERNPLVFCLFDDPRPYNVNVVLSALEKQGKLNSQGHPVKTRLIGTEQMHDPGQYDDCSLVYFNNDIDQKLRPAMYIALGKTILTIGANKGFVEQGGMTALVYEKGKHKLYINRDSYESSLVKIRSRLLSLAKFYPK